MLDPGKIRYLLVTHIPFARSSGGGVVLDGLWARDLEGLSGAGWNLRVCAPELSSESSVRPWGPNTVTLPPAGPIQFTGFSAISRRLDGWKWPGIRSVLRREVTQADVVHTSNLFEPYVGLSFAHDFAVTSGKKTLFVIAEDFHDMLDWEFVRMGAGESEISRRGRQLDVLDRRARRSASTASLTFLHTPAAVARYRLSARNSVAIRQPGHELSDVISEADFERKCSEILAGGPLKIVTACRHKGLKGLDFLIQAIALLKSRGIAVDAQLFGSGDLTQDLVSLSERTKVASQVSFPGSLNPGAEVYQAISRSHLFAMPHRTTDFGRAFFDAMAGAAPVIAFRTPASSETVQDGVDGLLASLDDIESLASAIARLHIDRELLVKLAKAARQRAVWNTRSEWYRLRSNWTQSLFAGETND